MKNTKNLKNVSAGAWLRLAALLIALINTSFEVFGAGPENTAGKILTVCAAVTAALYGYWKNNSFTPEAIEADEYLDTLRNKDS